MLRYLFFCFCLLLLNFIPVSIYAQSGTLIIGVTTTDGIVIACDSRASTFDTPDMTKEPIFYSDSFQKIFFIDKFPIALMGNSRVNCKPFRQIVSEFSSMPRGDTIVENILSDFKKYLQANYGTFNPGLNNEAYFGGGYFNHNAYLIDFNIDKWQVITHGIITSDSAVYPYFDKIPRHTYSSLEMAQIIEKIICDYAKDSHKTNKIGGPISIVTISKDNKITYIKNDFSANKYDDLMEYIKRVKNHKIKIHLVGDATWKYSIKVLESGPCYIGQK